MILKKISIHSFCDNYKREKITQYEYNVGSFAFELYDSKENPVNLSDCKSAAYYGTKADGTLIGNECEIADNKVIITPTLQMTACAGLLKGIIECQFESGNIRFYGIDFEILPAPEKAEIESTDEFTVFDKTLAQARLLLEKAENGELNGADGIGITSSEINENGELVLTYSDGIVTNLGVVVGDKGDKGDKGDTGSDYVLTEEDKTEIANTVLVDGNVKAAINNAALSKFSMRKNYKRNLEVMELPPDFNNNDFPLNIYSNGYNFHTDFDVTKYKNKGGTVYYCNPRARGTKDGLSELNATSFLDLSRSGKLSDGDTIILLDGVHQSCNCSSSEESISIPNVNIIAKNKRKAIVGNIMNNNSITWVNEGNGVFSADLTGTYTTVHNVIQKISDDFSSLKKVENAEDCDIQGTYAYISNVLYVHLFYNETPIRDNCMICKNYKFPCYEINSESKVITQYFEGVTFIGGTGSTLYVKCTDTYKHKVYAKDCDFLYAHDDTLAKDAVSIVGADAYFVGCKAMYSSKDGFNYHKNGNSIPNFVEIDCVGANNGNDGIALAVNSYWNNGSTAHEGVKGIRINCVYYNNYGGNVADVSDGTITLNLGCVAFDSSAVKTHTSACADFAAQQPGATMYLYGCKAFGSTSSAYAAANSTLYIKNCDFENGASGEGTIG